MDFNYGTLQNYVSTLVLFWRATCIILAISLPNLLTKSTYQILVKDAKFHTPYLILAMTLRKLTCMIPLPAYLIVAIGILQELT